MSSPDAFDGEESDGLHDEVAEMFKGLSPGPHEVNLTGVVGTGAARKVAISDPFKNYQTPEPKTWRNRHRPKPKNKAPITLREALACIESIKLKIRERAAQAVAREDFEIEGTVHARLRGDLGQELADLIKRLQISDPEAKREAHKEAVSLSKKGYGAVRAIESNLKPPTPDHLSDRDGEGDVQLLQHYASLVAICERASVLVERLAVTKAA